MIYSLIYCEECRGVAIARHVRKNGVIGASSRNTPLVRICLSCGDRTIKTLNQIKHSAISLHRAIELTIGSSCLHRVIKNNLSR
jgi:hypothetical protein